MEGKRTSQWGSCSHWTPGHFYSHGDFILDRNCQKRGTVDLEIRTRRGDCSRYSHGVSLSFPLECHMRIVTGLSRKLNLKIGVNRRGCNWRFWKLSTDGDHGKLRSAG